MILEARALRLSLPDRSARRGLGGPPMVEILKGVDLNLEAGQSLGIVGESGSGKTSLGRTLVGLHRPTGGSLRFEGREIGQLGEEEMRRSRARLQMIFQDPQSSLNPRQTVARILIQPLRALGMGGTRREALAQACGLLERVGLPVELLHRYPHQLSGGQRQRVGIARAIALEPAVVVADEIVSGLDVSSQAQILDLLRRLRYQMGLSLVFISHDLSVVRVVCDRVLVLLGGEVVEEGPCETVFSTPAHDYTRALIRSIPLPEIDPGWIMGDEAHAAGPG